MSLRKQLIRILQGKPKAKNLEPYEFSEEDRELSAQVRAKKMEIKLIELDKQMQIAELKSERDIAKLQDEIRELTGDDDEDDNPMDKLLISALAPLLNKVKNGQGNQSFETSPENTAGASLSVSLTDDKINEIVKSTPKAYLRIAKKMSDEQLNAQIKAQVPNIDDNSLSRARMAVRKA